MKIVREYISLEDDLSSFSLVGKFIKKKISDFLAAMEDENIEISSLDATS